MKGLTNLSLVVAVGAALGWASAARASVIGTEFGLGVESGSSGVLVGGFADGAPGDDLLPAGDASIAGVGVMLDWLDGETFKISLDFDEPTNAGLLKSTWTLGPLFWVKDGMLIDGKVTGIELIDSMTGAGAPIPPVMLMPPAVDSVSFMIDDFLPGASDAMLTFKLDVMHVPTPAGGTLMTAALGIVAVRRRR